MNEIGERVILNEHGVPFPTAEQAVDYQKKQGIEDTTRLKKYQGGWALVKPEIKTGSVTRPRRAKAVVAEAEPPAKEEEFLWVTFMPSSSPNDPKDVELAVNGDPLVCQRGIRVVLPARYLEVADHAVHEVYDTLAGHDRKVPRRIQSFPYQVHGPAKRSDFEAMLKQGKK